MNCVSSFLALFSFCILEGGSKTLYMMANASHWRDVSTTFIFPEHLYILYEPHNLINKI